MHERAICSCRKFNTAPSYSAFCFLCTQEPKFESHLCLWRTKADSFPYTYYCKLEVTLLKNRKGEPAWVSSATRYCLSAGSALCLALQVATHEPCLFLFCHRMIWDNRQTPSVPILGCFAFFFKICP